MIGDDHVDYCVKHQIDLVIPTIDPDLLRLDDIRCSLPTMLLSKREALDICNDKARTKDTARGLNIPVPDDACTNYYYVKKPTVGSASQGVVILTEPEEPEDGYVYEEYVGGDEITVDVLSDMSGTAQLAVARRRIRVRGGEVSVSCIERNEQLESRSKVLANSLGLIGPSTVQYKGGKLLEVNARVGGGLPLTIAAGGDWPRAILNMVQGRRFPKMCITNGVQMNRYDQSVFHRPTKLVEYYFDLDDTLYLERSYVYAGYRAAAQKVWTDHRLDIEGELYSRCGEDRIFNKVLPDADESYIRELVQLYRDNPNPIELCVDVIDSLRELRKRGHAIFIMTGGVPEVQKHKIEKLGLSGLVDGIFYGKDIPEGGVYVGDNMETDVGDHFTTIRIRRPYGLHYNQDTPEGVRCIRTLKELL